MIFQEVLRNAPRSVTPANTQRYDATTQKAWVDRHLPAPVDPLTTTHSTRTEPVAVLSMPMSTDSSNRVTRTERQAELLRVLREVRADREALRRNEADLVGWARDLGATWGEIGQALGITARGAMQAALRRRDDA